MTCGGSSRTRDDGDSPRCRGANGWSPTGSAAMRRAPGGRADAALSRPAGGGAADAVRPHRHAEPPLERMRLPTAHRVAGTKTMAGPKAATDAAQARRFRLEGGLPVWVYDVEGVASRSGSDAAPAEHHARDLPAARRQIRSASNCVRRRIPSARGAREPAPRRPATPSRLRRSVRNLRPAATFRRCGCVLHGEGTAFTLDERDGSDACLRASRRTAATTARVRCGVPAISASDWRRRAADARCFDRDVGNDRRAQPGGGLRRRKLTRARCSLAACRPRRTARPRSWCWPPTSSSSRPPAGSRSRARPRGRRRSPHGDRRLSLVHRLGPRHDDQPEGLTLCTGRHAKPAISCAPSPTMFATD